MRRSRSSCVSHSIPIASLIAGLLVAILAVPLSAQSASETRTAGHGIGPVYDAAHEITLNATIQTVVTKHTPGTPAGMHLLVTGENGLIDAHVGSFLTKDVREALHAGLPIQVVGSFTQLHGKQYLLARELSFGGRTVTVRNRNGMLVHAVVPRTRASVRRTAQKTANGGAR